MKFRKKPVVIEAYQFRADSEETRDIPGWLIKAMQIGIIYEIVDRTYIRTLEGPLTVSDGDWIVKSGKGELYPCKPDIFAATYEPVEP